MKRKLKLVGLGEVLWDLLPGGRQLGGAPANFAYHASALGAEGTIISRVGRDADGDAIIERLQELGLSTNCIEVDPEAPTGTVSVEVMPDGQPRFTIHEGVAWDRLAGTEKARRAVVEADAICFGTLGQRADAARATIRSLLELANDSVTTRRRDEQGRGVRPWRIFDVNLRQHFFSRAVIEQSLAQTDVLKVNDTELPQIAAMLGIFGDARAQILELATRHDLRIVACTRGAHGSLLFAEGHWSDHPGVRAKVVDTVGAGDAFTAAMIIGLLSGWALDEINERANQIAAYVASRAGATPQLPKEFRAIFESGSLKS